MISFFITSDGKRIGPVISSCMSHEQSPLKPNGLYTSRTASLRNMKVSPKMDDAHPILATD
jgi:hypothetical protein